MKILSKRHPQKPVSLVEKFSKMYPIEMPMDDGCFYAPYIPKMRISPVPRRTKLVSKRHPQRKMARGSMVEILPGGNEMGTLQDEWEALGKAYAQGFLSKGFVADRLDIKMPEAFKYVVDPTPETLRSVDFQLASNSQPVVKIYTCA